MSELRIKIRMDNAAFDPDFEFEAARILRETAERIEQRGEDGFSLMDYNGNKVGEYDIIPD